MKENGIVSKIARMNSLSLDDYLSRKISEVYHFSLDSVNFQIYDAVSSNAPDAAMRLVPGTELAWESDGQLQNYVAFVRQIQPFLAEKGFELAYIRQGMNGISQREPPQIEAEEDNELFLTLIYRLEENMKAKELMEIEKYANNLIGCYCGITSNAGNLLMKEIVESIIDAYRHIEEAVIFPEKVMNNVVK